MAEVYKNTATDINAYAEDGWDLMPINLTGGQFVAFKEIEIPFEDEFVQGLLGQYDSNAFQEVALKIEHISKYYDRIGFRFDDVYDDSSGKTEKRLRVDDDTKRKLCTWRVEIDLSDGYIRLSPFDVAFPYSFYNKALLERYAGGIVESLLGKGLIECATISS